MSNKILIIDDDEKLSGLLQRYFSQFGLELITATSGEAGLAQLKQAPDVVILDVMLPGKSGFDLCQEIRQACMVPIIMLTARTDVTDRIVGLKLGADDYVVKPVDPRELLARIESVLRRTQAKPTESGILRFEGLEINVNARTVLLDETEVKLSTMEFEVLLLLTRNQGKVLSRDELLDNLRGIEFESFNRSIDVLISRLRQKLKDDPKNPRFFKTVWGSGYLFIGNKESSRKAS